MQEMLRELAAAANRPLPGRINDQGDRKPEMGIFHYTQRQKMERCLSSGIPVSMFLFEIEDFDVLKDLYGGLPAVRILEIMDEQLAELAREHLKGCGYLFMQSLMPGRYVILCGSRELAPQDRTSDILLAFRLQLRSRIRQEAMNLTGHGLDVLAGSAFIGKNGSRPLEQVVYDALLDAQRMAKGLIDASRMSLVSEFRSIVAERRLKALFQPIVALRSGEIMAWEALTRGPEGSHFHSPEVLFDFAEEVDGVFDLERVCREKAIYGIGRLEHDQRLFLNINPRTLVAPNFAPGETVGLLEKNGLSPEKVVLEVTERHCIQDFGLFHRTLDHYRRQGFKVAVDDVGTGYSGLWSIAEIKPDFMKVDMSLVQGIESDPVKRALLETFVTFAESIGSRVIAEGIENDKDLGTLMRIGVHYGQGFFLRRPAHPKPGLPAEVQSYFSSTPVGSGQNGGRKCSMPIRDLVEDAVEVSAEATVDEVRQLLGENGQSGSVVVVEDQRPLGLVMTHHIDHALSSRFGNSLYSRRSVSLIMDPSPLFAEGGTPVENVAREAMGRKKAKVFDHIVVTEQGLLSGIVSVQNMLDAMASVQVEMAKGANPLTGLPGNVAIEQELERRCRSGAPFSVVYADLDNFKVYNDVYGFKNGDDVILLLAKVLGWAARRHGNAGEDFVGHIGGDDMVLVTTPARARRLCRGVLRCFGRLVRNHYMPQDRKRGWIEGTSRSGQVRTFPLVSVSLAVVDCAGQCDLSDLGRRAAEMKKYAKSIEGNSWARDRRGPLGTDDPEDGNPSSGG